MFEDFNGNNELDNVIMNDGRIMLGSGADMDVFINPSTYLDALISSEIYTDESTCPLADPNFEGSVFADDLNMNNPFESSDDNLAELLNRVPEILDVQPSTLETPLVDHLNFLADEEQSGFPLAMEYPQGELMDATKYARAIGSANRFHPRQWIVPIDPLSPGVSSTPYSTHNIETPSPATSPTMYSPHNIGPPSPAMSPPYSPHKIEREHNYANCYNDCYNLTSNVDTDYSTPLLDNCDFSSVLKENDRKAMLMVNPGLVLGQTSENELENPSFDLGQTSEDELENPGLVLGQVSQIKLENPDLALGHVSHNISPVLSERDVNREVVPGSLKTGAVRLQLQQSINKKHADRQKKTKRLGGGTMINLVGSYRAVRTIGKPEAYTKRMRKTHIDSMKSGAKAKKIKTENTRCLHNDLEKKRRIAMSVLFESLVKCVPSLSSTPNDRASKVKILERSKNFIDNLRDSEMELELTLSQLKEEKIEKVNIIKDLELSYGRMLEQPL